MITNPDTGALCGQLDEADIGPALLQYVAQAPADDAGHTQRLIDRDFLGLLPSRPTRKLGPGVSDVELVYSPSTGNHKRPVLGLSWPASEAGITSLFHYPNRPPSGSLSLRHHQRQRAVSPWSEAAVGNGTPHLHQRGGYGSAGYCCVYNNIIMSHKSLGAC